MVILKLLLPMLTLCVAANVAAESTLTRERPDTLFQYATINALLQGLYDGDMSVSQLTENGDFGIGTYNGLDGEMILFEGVAYKIKMDGRAYPQSPQEQTPFAVTTFFDTDQESDLPANLSYADLKKHLDGMVKNVNFFQAFRIDGRFAKMRVRSVPGQQPPYAPLAQVVDKQAVFNHADVEGTLIGFRTPSYAAGLNIPGYHFHFLTKDRSQGGHVLDLATTSGRIAMDRMAGFQVALPGTSGFARADLSGKRKQELHKVEMGN